VVICCGYSDHLFAVPGTGRAHESAERIGRAHTVRGTGAAILAGVARAVGVARGRPAASTCEPAACPRGSRRARGSCRACWAAAASSFASGAAVWR